MLTAPRASRKDWAALAVLVLPVLLISVDITVLGLALPYLSQDLGPTSAEQLWIVDIYSFMLAGLLVLMGTLGDRIGRRRLLLVGATTFGAASAAAAYADSAVTLIAARALLGVGGATLMPSTLALIRNIFRDQQQRKLAIGVWSACFSAGIALGPVIGGWLLEDFWWGSVFLINLPVMALLLVLAPALLPEARDPAPGRLDPLSAVLSLATALPVVYGIKAIAEQGATAAAAVGIVAGFGVGVLFVLRQRRLVDPMIQVDLFRHRAFSASITTNLLAALGVTSLFVLAPQYLQLVLGLRPMVAALWILPAAVAGIIGGLLAPQLLKHWHASTVTAAGLLLGAAGFFALTRIQIGASTGLTALTVGLVLVGGGITLATTVTNDLVVSAVPPERAGAAAAVSETGFELGGALSIAVLGSAATATYRDAVASPSGLPLPAWATDAALETLGGAVAAARQLPEPLGDALLGIARQAFVDAVHVAALIGVALMLYNGAQAALLLRRVRTRPEDGATSGTVPGAVSGTVPGDHDVGAVDAG